MKYLLYISTLLLLCSCTAYNEIYLDQKKYQLPNPPNTVQLSTNLFIEESECINAEYKDYLSWMKNVFGTDSESYQSAIPEYLNKDNSPFFDSLSKYFLDVEYGEFAVLGISIEQANSFAIWKSDRVNEFILLERGVLAYRNSTAKEKESPKTILKDFKGQFAKKHKKVAQYPLLNYRIATEKEWEKGGFQRKSSLIEFQANKVYLTSFRLIATYGTVQ